MSDARSVPPTSAEIDRRLRIVAELRNLCRSLGQARRIVEPLPGPGEAAVGEGKALAPLEPVPDIAPPEPFR